MKRELQHAEQVDTGKRRSRVAKRIQTEDGPGNEVPAKRQMEGQVPGVHEEAHIRNDSGAQSGYPSPTSQNPLPVTWQPLETLVAVPGIAAHQRPLDVTAQPPSPTRGVGRQYGAGQCFGIRLEGAAGQEVREATEDGDGPAEAD